jgi:hypothetical protein
MDDAYEALRLAIAHRRAQLAFLPPGDPQCEQLVRDLLWCYHEAFALLTRRIAARRASSAGPGDQHTDRTPDVTCRSPDNAPVYTRCIDASSLTPIAQFHES